MRTKYSHTLLLITVLILSTYSNIFPAIIEGTLVKTPCGLIPVENLRTGDNVISGDYEKLITTEAEIIQIDYNSTNTVIKIEINNEILYSSKRQLFYEPNLKKWVRAKDLSAGNVLVDRNFIHHKILKVESLIIDAKLYEISLKPPHTFFIYDSQILTHNYAYIVTHGYRIFTWGIEALKAIARSPAIKQAITTGATALGSVFLAKSISRKNSQNNKTQRVSENQNKENPTQHKNISGHKQKRTLKRHQKAYRKFFIKRAKASAKQARSHYKMQQKANKNRTNTSPTRNQTQNSNNANTNCKSKNRSNSKNTPQKGSSSSNGGSFTPNNNGNNQNGPKNEEPGKAPGKPTEKDGFKPPKGKVGNGGKKVKHPETGQWGWKDAKGNIWVPTGKGPLAHGGPHWDVIDGGGDKIGDVFPGGKWR